MGYERCWFGGRKCIFPTATQQQKEQAQLTKVLLSCHDTSLASSFFTVAKAASCLSLPMRQISSIWGQREVLKLILSQMEERYQEKNMAVKPPVTT